MGRKIEEYKKKLNKIIKTIELLGISIFLLGILISIIQYTINKSKSLEENANASNGDSEYFISIENNTIVYNNKFSINVDIDNFDEKSRYKICINFNDRSIIKEENILEKNEFDIELDEEGYQKGNISIYKNNDEKYNKDINIYYINPYQKQFIDELSKNGITVHYKNGTLEKYDYSKNQLKGLGVNFVRADFVEYSLGYKENEIDKKKYDWVEDLMSTSNIKILALIYSSPVLKNDQQSAEKYINYVNNLIKSYPEIKNFQLQNELNLVYYNKEDINWYSKILNEVIKNNNNVNIYSAGTATFPNNTSWCITSKNFFNYLYETNGVNLIKHLSYHPYDYTKYNNLTGIYEKMREHKELFNGFGGFIYQDITEFGCSIRYNTEDEQAINLVKQIANAEDFANLKMIYNLWTTSDSSQSDSIEQFGLLRNDYTPRPAYYSMKNFYQNTNGAEYIGTLNLQSNLEAHIYNKDGKPLIIAWSEDTVDFPLNTLTTKDLYGKEITPDENGNIQITTSPVYLYNAGNNYFYQAISNVSTTKYDEFTQKFAEQISAIPGLQASITKLKKSMQDISNNSTLNETTALNLMKEHYNLGNTILQAYKSGTLQVEAVKISSMLDALDDIGDSFEDLVTVSAKTRNSNLTETRNLIATAEKLIKDNEDLEIIYPTKILNFSQDFYDKASYINSLEEENDIKTGLIVSKNLHSLLLANWANEFAKIYIDKYVSNIPVEIEYSNTEPTNKEVTATLKTDAAITVTNNQNSKTYKFTENGEFTFEYTIRGQAFTKKATVTNIDKTPPVITGVENEGFYTGSVTPKVTDTNLKEVKLYKNSTLVQNYASNSPIAQDGNYKIVATDKAGNQTTVTFYICKIPATISYSETNITNKNVTATINSNYDLQVTNNSGKKTYTFTNNGTFTFNYKIKGKAFTVTATVNNIDKKAPVITGVEEGKLYIDQAVIPKVTDENLKEVNLYLNSVQVSNFSSGTQVTKEGFYKIVAIDKAGNQTTINFSLMKNNSKEYKVKGKYIINITSNTKKTDFVKNFNNTSQHQVTRNGKALTNNDIIATGDILKSNNGDEYTLIVTGDINKDGDVDIVDIVKLRRYLLLRNNLDEAALLAADCNLDGESLSVTDLVKLRLIVLYKGAT